MGLILKISRRNIMRHKGKSLIIGIILFIGAFLMTFGNGVISGMDKGLEQNIVSSFMGHIVLISEKEKSDNILFRMYGETIGSFSNFKDIDKFLSQKDYIDMYLPAGKNMAFVLNEGDENSEGGSIGNDTLLGVDIKRYRKMFPDNFSVIEGQILGDDEKGVLIPKTGRESFYKWMNVWYVPEGGNLNEKNLTDDARKDINDLNVKDKIIYMGLNDSNSTTDIRQNIKGIIKYKALNTIWGYVSIMDIESYRECMGYISAEDLVSDVPESKKQLMSLDNENLDDMFNESAIVVNDVKSAAAKVDFSRRENLTRKDADVDAGPYNLVFIKLKNGVMLNKYVKDLNEELKKTNLGVKAVTWKKATGQIGSIAMIVKGALFVFVMILFFVAIIIIVNTLTMAALERITEIGMMRAIGARKGFISVMFFGETSLLSGIFGGAGIGAGVILVKLIPLLKITSDNDIVQLLYGGDYFSPVLSAGDVMMTILQLIVVTLLTVIYPIKVAKSITPLDAIARD